MFNQFIEFFTKVGITYEVQEDRQTILWAGQYYPAVAKIIIINAGEHGDGFTEGNFIFDKEGKFLGHILE